MAESASFSMATKDEVALDLGFPTTIDMNNGYEPGPVRRNSKYGRFRDCRTWMATMHRSAPDAVGVSGLKYVLHASVNRYRRFGWIFILGCACTMLTVQVIDRVVYYASYPLSVETEIDHQVEYITFPKVVVCNMNSFVKSATQNNSAFDAYLQTLQVGVLDPNVSDNLSEAYQEQLLAMDTDQVLLDLAHQPENMFLWIEYGDQVLSISNVTYVYTNYGLCYQINDGIHGDLLKAKRPGKSQGLSMILNVEQYEYYYGINQRYSAGFMMLLLPQTEVAMVAEFGFGLGPGTENFVALSAREEINIGPPFGVCGERELKYYAEYSYTKCELECITDVVVNKCGCKSFYMPGNATVCDPLSSVCAEETIGKMESINQFVNDICKCPVNCDTRKYVQSLSAAKYPSSFWAESLANLINEHVDDSALNINDTFFENNIVSVEVFFDDISIAKVKQQAAYSFFALLADIGGSMGLWLGGSLLTFYEILDLCGYSFFTHKRNVAGESRRQ